MIIIIITDINIIIIISISTLTAKVRLADGVSPNEGRLLVYYNEAWGEVCDYYDTPWSKTNSHVICRILGFSHAIYATQHAATVYGEKSEFKWLIGLRCEGNESNVSECPDARWGSVRGCHEIGLICSTDTGSRELFGTCRLYTNDIIALTTFVINLKI